MSVELLRSIAARVKDVADALGLSPDDLGQLLLDALRIAAFLATAADSMLSDDARARIRAVVREWLSAADSAADSEPPASEPA